MEHIPETLIRGNFSDEEKESIKKEREYYLRGQGEEIDEDFEFFNEHTREKTEQEITAIELANEETNKLLLKFGVQPFNIPTKNYYILPKKNLLWRRASNLTQAGVIPSHNICLFKDTKKGIIPILFSLWAFHETLHLKSYISFKQEPDSNLGIYRTGITVYTSKKNKEKTPRRYLNSLNEAINTKMDREYLNILLQRPEFEKEAKWWKSKECNLLKAFIATYENISPKDIFWIEPWGRNLCISGYTRATKLLDYICSEIQKKKPDKYPSEEDVFTEFQRAQITGNILNIARDITHTFGEGSFRKIASYPEDWRLRLHFETLKLKRKINKS